MFRAALALSLLVGSSGWGGTPASDAGPGEGSHRAGERDIEQHTEGETRGRVLLAGSVDRLELGVEPIGPRPNLVLCGPALAEYVAVRVFIGETPFTRIGGDVTHTP